MASKRSLCSDELSCPVCLRIFQDPVILPCSHSICRGCLRLFWSSKKFKECPVCRKRSTSVSPPSNLVLKNVCESFRKESGPSASAESELLCHLHHEKLKLYCQVDKQPVCVVCQSSKVHKNHDCCPVDEAAHDQREELKTALKGLQRRLEKLKTIEVTCNQTANHIETQVNQTEKQIKDDFERLHQFLRDEEAAKIAALREEEEQKRQMIKEKIGETSREILHLSDTIRSVEEELSIPDVPFLQNFTMTIKRARCTLPEPEMVSGALLHEAKHLSNLQFKIWNKMQGIIQYVPVSLDPNTANPKLILSEDLTCLKMSPEKQQLPDNPERFDRFACVLGSEVFTSGVRSWDVEVGESTYWILGVISQSVQRKEVSFWSGLWCLQFHNGEYEIFAPGKAWSVLHVKKRPQRVRVLLDRNRGKVTFSDPLTDTHLHTLTHTFTEGVLPLFHNGCKCSPLRILPAKYHVLV